MKQWIRRRTPAIAGLAALVSVSLLASTAVVSNASWNDTEWVHSGTEPIGTLNCADPGNTFTSRGVGRALSGTLLGINLDAVAQASGVTATHNAGVAAHTPEGANEVMGPVNAWANPLKVEVLGNAIGIDLGSGMLQLPLDNSTGVLGQYGQASAGGQAAGAAGLLSDTGGIGLEHNDGYPELAKLKLTDLLGAVNQPVAGLVGNAADIDLTVGAVTGRATLDGCAALWANDISDALTREYLATSLDLGFTSPAVGALVTGIDGVLNTAQTSVTNLAGEASLLNSLQSGILGLVSGLLSGRGLAEVNVSGITLGLNLAPVRSLLTQTISDSHNLVAINLSTGRVDVDLAALLAHAYSTESSTWLLNDLPPNSNILAQDNEGKVVNALKAAVGEAVATLIADVQTKLIQQLDQITVQFSAALTLTPILTKIPVANITVNGTLATLTSGGGVSIDLGGGILGLLGEALLGNVLNALQNGVGPKVASTVKSAVNALNLPALLTSSAFSAPTTALVNAVAQVYTGLFLSGVVAVTINAQNRPLSGFPEPGDWAGLEPGRFDVAAIRVGVLDLTRTKPVAIYLGRGSVGPACVVGGRCVGVP